MYIPSNIQNYEDLKMEPPSDRLELDWVYPSRMPQQCTASLLVFRRIMLHSDRADSTVVSFSGFSPHCLYWKVCL